MQDLWQFHYQIWNFTEFYSNLNMEDITDADYMHAT